jgi:hypothetical protein
MRRNGIAPYVPVVQLVGRNNRKALRRIGFCTITPCRNFNAAQWHCALRPSTAMALKKSQRCSKRLPVAAWWRPSTRRRARSSQGVHTEAESRAQQPKGVAPHGIPHHHNVRKLPCGAIHCALRPRRLVGRKNRRALRRNGYRNITPRGNFNAAQWYCAYVPGVTLGVRILGIWRILGVQIHVMHAPRVSQRLSFSKRGMTYIGIQRR